MRQIRASKALLETGWQDDVLVSVDESGVIAAVEKLNSESPSEDAVRVGILLASRPMFTAMHSSVPWPV
ncbi:MAG: hypothetical protein R3D29_00745 [Nitratireductor sp.]